MGNRNFYGSFEYGRSPSHPLYPLMHRPRPWMRIIQDTATCMGDCWSFLLMCSYHSHKVPLVCSTTSLQLQCPVRPTYLLCEARSVTATRGSIADHPAPFFPHPLSNIISGLWLIQAVTVVVITGTSPTLAIATDSPKRLEHDRSEVSILPQPPD